MEDDADIPSYWCDYSRDFSVELVRRMATIRLR